MALLWKMIYNLGDPMSLRHSVVVLISHMSLIRVWCDSSICDMLYSHVCVQENDWSRKTYCTASFVGSYADSIRVTHSHVCVHENDWSRKTCCIASFVGSCADFISHSFTCVYRGGALLRWQDVLCCSGLFVGSCTDSIRHPFTCVCRGITEVARRAVLHWLVRG